ncbi:MAG: Gfo/Idh/MocA family oxidoreductase [Chloroflexi bacterium]|nr:Gfo/Idh/MocA family oxidoreductase [Chloroflexota bacterium]
MAALLRIAVLGTGNRAMDHLQTLSRLGALCQLVAVCDADAERVARVSAQYGAPAYTGLEHMLAEARPDLLYVIIHPDGHRAATEVAAQHGVNVVSETPIAPTLPMADAMIAAARRHRVKLEVSENVPRWPNERLKLKIVQSGLIGRVTQVHLWYMSGSYHGMSMVRKLIPGVSGAPPVRARGFVRETPVPPHVDRAGRRLATGPYEHGLVEFADGAICVYQYPLYHHRGNYWDVIGSEGAIIGSDLVLVRNGERRVFPIRQRPGEQCESREVPVLEAVHVETDPPIAWENHLRDFPIGATADAIARADVVFGMHRAIREGTDPDYGAANARADQEILIAIRESALRDGAWISLPLTEVTETEQRIHDEYRRQHGQDPLGPAGEAIRAFYPFVSPAEVALGKRYP